LQAYVFSPAGADEWRRQLRRAARKTPANYGNHPGSNRKRRPLRKAGECYTAGSYGRAIQYACELAFGMPKELRRAMQDETDEQRAERNRLAAEWRREHCWHPHQLRHNAATLFRREYGLEVPRVLLGHKTTDITELYAEADQQRAVEVMAKIG
jgi:integrase